MIQYILHDQIYSCIQKSLGERKRVGREGGEREREREGGGEEGDGGKDSAHMGEREEGREGEGGGGTSLTNLCQKVVN